MTKRLFDIVGSAVGLILLAPLFWLIALVVRFSDGGPVFYRQERVGRHGRRFRIWKFRTMVVGADRQGRAITVGEDARITPVGYWLRKLKLDELPQLINVLVGEMSFVGPRPEVPKYVALYDDRQRRVLAVQPGITDPASIRYRNESELLAKADDPERHYVETIMPNKIRLNLAYAARATLWSDIGVIFQTLLSVGRDSTDEDAREESQRSTGVTDVDDSSAPTICLLSAEHPPLDKRVFQKEAVSLAQAGFRVIHLCPSNAAEDKSVKGVRLVTYKRRRGRLERLLSIPRLLARAWRLDADVYHCNEPDSWLVGVLLSLLRGKKVVFDCHEHYPGQVTRGLSWPLSHLAAWATKYYLQLLGLLTHRIVLAKYSVADDFSWSRGRQVVVLNTTPLNALDSRMSTISADATGNSEPFTFVHIGVIRRERGSQQLLDAVRLLADRGVSDFRVRIIGAFKDGSEADFFAKADRHGVRERIEFHRWLPFDEAFSLVRRSHAGLILFQKTLENNVRGMPHKMFDYMLAGLPVIAPDFAPDIVNVLGECGGGLLVDTSDVSRVADAMQMLIEDRAMVRSLGARGRQAVFDRYHWERDAETLIAAYHEMLGTMPMDLSARRTMKKAA